jgi:hypothetical protein
VSDSTLESKPHCHRYPVDGSDGSCREKFCPPDTDTGARATTLTVALWVPLEEAVWFEELGDDDVHPAIQIAATSNATITPTIMLRFI